MFADFGPYFVVAYATMPEFADFGPYFVVAHATMPYFAYFEPYFVVAYARIPYIFSLYRTLPMRVRSSRLGSLESMIRIHATSHKSMKYTAQKYKQLHISPSNYT